MNVWKFSGSGSGDGHPEKRKEWMQNLFFFAFFYLPIHVLQTPAHDPQQWMHSTLTFLAGQNSGQPIDPISKKGIRCTDLIISIINWHFFYVHMTNDTSSFWLINPTCTIVAKSGTRPITFYTIEGWIWIILNEIGNWFETASSINNYTNKTGQKLKNKDFSNSNFIT